MNIAENKKQNNISEYIIYMYQTEDLIRVYEFDIELIKQYVIKHFPVSEEEKAEMAEWYLEIMAQMKKEEIHEKGHLSTVQKYVEHLSRMMDDLKTSNEEFKKIYDNAAPYIKESLEIAQGQITDEVQICLNGIYGLLLARMNGREVPQELMPGINSFGDVLSYLSFKYKQKNFLSDN
ncbi:DUF4924 family protein [Fulvivirga sediminis]|uniref:DUF4924 family protein n=1 Tax=Fulvivirga sediminis TaxID=2803949 RepID=A0A937F482_9BACT|nr:DUF4924 family protein [Fulvivirga sediminis]MBL3656057.1 DUF4924 family protein [Fulvivirga sediminis]